MKPFCGKFAALTAISTLCALLALPPEAAADGASVERGRYIARTAGCNDCHTAGYLPEAGKVPEAQWLLGDRLGWRGDWGTTYASNLRISMGRMSEEQWIEFARTAELRPPMPWFNLRAMNDDDLRSIYRFTRSLGASGEPAPGYLPPGVEPQGPYVLFSSPPSNENGVSIR